MTNAIRAQELSKRFGKVTAVDRCSLEVPDGSVFALIGSNRSGKSTAGRFEVQDPL